MGLAKFQDKAAFGRIHGAQFGNNQAALRHLRRRRYPPQESIEFGDDGVTCSFVVSAHDVEHVLHRFAVKFALPEHGENLRIADAPTARRRACPHVQPSLEPDALQEGEQWRRTTHRGAGGMIS